MVRYQDELINQPPKEAPVDIGGYSMRRKRPKVQSSDSSELESSSSPESGRIFPESGTSQVKRPRGRPRKELRATPPPSPRTGEGERVSVEEEEEDFSSVGGLEDQLMVLQESVVFPLLYPWMFGEWGRRAAPRGILLTGHSGCGKTLCVRALVGTLKKEGVNVHLITKKGADALSKYVGEGERKLKEVFDQAKQNQPAIIFFDELDGLAPIRSSESSAVHHTSLVTTLLALMDGIEHRGEQVIVIGATNRPEALDPALRRPGRFDKELKFSPPKSAEERLQILKVCVRKWPKQHKPKDAVLEWVAMHTENCTGADLNALVNEAVMTAVRRQFGHMYLSTTAAAASAMPADKNSPKEGGVKVRSQDFVLALRVVNPNRAMDFEPFESSNWVSVSPLLKALFSEEISALTRTIADCIGMSASTAGVPDYFRSNVMYVYIPEAHAEFPSVFRYAVLPAALGGFSEKMNTISISGYNEDLQHANAAAALVHMAMKRSPAIVLVEDSVFNKDLVSIHVQKAVKEALRAVLLPGNRVFAVFMGRADELGKQAEVRLVPKLETSNIRQRIEKILLQHAEVTVRELHAASSKKTSDVAAKTQELEIDQNEADKWHGLFKGEIDAVLMDLETFLGRYVHATGKGMSVEEMKRKNAKSKYLALGEVVEDVEAVTRELAPVLAREFREMAHRRLRAVNKDVVRNLDAARERLARRLAAEGDEEDEEETEEEAIPAKLRLLVREKASEIDIAYNNWDTLANDVVSAVRYIQARARNMI